MMANMTSGDASLMSWVQKKGSTIDGTLLTLIRSTEERTGLIHHVGEKLFGQIMTSLSIKDIAEIYAAGVSPSVGQQYISSQSAINKFTNLVLFCRANPPKIVYTLISSNITSYNIIGPMTNVTAVQTALNEAGGTSQISTSTHAVVSESLLKKPSPLKRNLSWPTGPALPAAVSGPNLFYNRIQIPTTNWDDIQRIYQACPVNVYTGSKSYKFYAENMLVAMGNFYASVNEFGVKTAHMSYDALKSMGTYDVTYTYSS